MLTFNENKIHRRYNHLNADAHPRNLLHPSDPIHTKNNMIPENCSESRDPAGKVDATADPERFGDHGDGESTFATLREKTRKNE